MVMGSGAQSVADSGARSDAGSDAGSDAWSVAGLVSVRASLPAISGICGFEGLVARISGYSSNRYLLNGAADHLGEGAHMKRVLVIATGGTIASAEEGSGLAPALTGEQLVAFVPEVAQICHVEVSQVMNADSTNMRPEGWLAIADEVHRRYDDFDGFVVLHGTDTLAYTAAGLSYLVQGSPKPVVLTGSQLPMGDPGTDGKRNLLDAVRVACDDAAVGVMVAFGGKVISGTAARKVRTRSFEAFDSLNVPDLGYVRDGRVEWAADGSAAMRGASGGHVAEASAGRAAVDGGAHATPIVPTGDSGDASEGRACASVESQIAGSSDAHAAAAAKAGGVVSGVRFYDALNPRVAVFKITPGMDALVVDALRPACDALVVEAFGLGGIPEYDGITDTLLAWADAGKTLVMTTQCPYEGADLSVYEVGRAFCDRPGVLMGGSATTEALLAKTMWALAQAADPDGIVDREQLAELFASC